MKYKRTPIGDSGQVTDVRGRPGRRATRIGVGGGGIGLIVVLLLTLFGGGGDLGPLLDQLQPQAVPQEQAPLEPGSDPDADLKVFMTAVHDDAQAMWSEIFRQSNLTYEPTTLVIFTEFTESGCGGADSRVGPHYCPADRKAYLDFDFFRDLHQKFGAPGDTAQAYVLTHEIGHHVQTLLGISDQVRSQQQQDPTSANEVQVKMELQADCFAGLYGFRVANNQSPVFAFEPGDVQEALGAAAAVGDDRIQEQSGLPVNPESFTHGTAEQRQQWFTTGLNGGDPNACNTFG